MDDNKELDILKSLIDPYLPPNIVLLNTEFDLFNYKSQIEAKNVHFVVKACRYVFEERNENKVNHSFNFLLQQANLELV